MSTPAVLDFPITGRAPLATATRALGYKRFAEVAEALRGLPYGRVRDTENLLAVLDERRGTCSSKHRFLAALAHECGRADVALMVGLYEMSEQNTPGVGGILRQAGLDSLPEAHCYLMYEGQRLDFTGLAPGVASPFDSLIEERSVLPRELTTAKVAFHRAAMARWARSHDRDPEYAWELREDCIRVLAGLAPLMNSDKSAGPRQL